MHFHRWLLFARSVCMCAGRLHWSRRASEWDWKRRRDSIRHTQQHHKFISHLMYAVHLWSFNFQPHASFVFFAYVTRSSFIHVSFCACARNKQQHPNRNRSNCTCIQTWSIKENERKYKLDHSAASFACLLKLIDLTWFSSKRMEIAVMHITNTAGIVYYVSILIYSTHHTQSILPVHKVLYRLRAHNSLSLSLSFSLMCV